MSHRVECECDDCYLTFLLEQEGPCAVGPVRRLMRERRAALSVVWATSHARKQTPGWAGRILNALDEFEKTVPKFDSGIQYNTMFGGGSGRVKATTPKGDHK